MANNMEDVASALDDLIDESMDYERGNWTGFVKTPQEREDAIAQVSAHKMHVLDLIQQEANRQKDELLDGLESMAAYITADRKRVELGARIEENRRWLTVLAPSMDENVAYNSDFHSRIAELKAQQEEV